MRLVAVAALLLVAAPVAGQGHEHNNGEAYVLITHDAPDDGRTYVGNVNHFGFILFGTDGRPAFHHNFVVEVLLNGVTLLATSSDSGHDYDGVGELDVAFPATGRYEVRVTSEGGEDALGSFRGTVHRAPALSAQLAVDGPQDVPVGELATFTYSLTDSQGALIPHSDVLVSVRAMPASYEVFRVHTHTHEEAQAFSYAFDAPGDYEIVLTGYQAYPSESVADFMPVVSRHAVTVSADPTALVAVPPAVPTRRPLENIVEDGESAAPNQLLLTYDPYSSTGLFGTIRLNALVVDGTGAAVPHVNFHARLVSPGGETLFESATLHEYDGVFDVKTSHRALGDYVLEVEASRGEWKASGALTYSIHAPLVPLGAGPQFTELQGLDGVEAGKPAELTFFSHNAAGLPFAHSELDVRVVDEMGLPVYATKLHTHGDGLFPFTVAFPHAGTYTVEADPHALEPAPTPFYFGPAVGSFPRFTVDVADGPGIPSLPVDEGLETTEETPDEAPLPLAGLLAFVVLAGAALLTRRGYR